MLRELHITGLGVIADLDLELVAGLNVLTGETGAGKTMVTVGLALALGARGSASLVREGAPVARVQARFDAPPGATEWAEDGEILLARSIGRDGRSGSRVGGQLATTSILAEIGFGLVEVHGQHQGRRLLSGETQTAFLDRFAGDAQLRAVEAFRQTFERLRVTRGTLAGVREAARDRDRELDLLAYQVREIEAVAPRPGESEELAAEGARLAHVERLLELCGGAEEGLAAEAGGGDALASAAQALDAASSLDAAAAELAARGRGLAAEAGELARDIRGYRESLLVDPERLQRVRERIEALRALRRKYGETDDDVIAFLAEAARRHTEIGDSGDRLATLEAEAALLEQRASREAALITEGRTVAAPRLAHALVEELGELGMPGAAVDVALDRADELRASGAERVELRLAPGPGQPSLPLARAASGGELSRAMLACRSLLADVDDVPTIVFDEVDAGIGGHAGLAVGRRLARLATSRQVLVVTHLPQIACFADAHVRVRKQDGTTAIEVLDDRGRVAELSRMLAGLDGSESAASHAEELMVEALRFARGPHRSAPASSSQPQPLVG